MPPAVDPAAAVREIERRKREDPVHVYRPQPQQLPIHQSRTPITVAEGGNRCLAGWERVYDPWTRQYRRIDSINGPFHVWSRDPATGQRFIAVAGKPFTKGVGEFFQWNLSNGESFTATPSHRVLASDGQWHSLACLLALGESAPCLPASSADTFLSAFPRDGDRCSQTTEGCRGGCWPGSRQCGERPRLSQEGGRSSPPSPVGAHGYTHCCSNGGALVDRQGYTHACQPSDHPSIRYAPSLTWVHVGGRRIQIASQPCSLTFETYREGRRSADTSGHPPRTTSSSAQPASQCSAPGACVRLLSAIPIGHYTVWDFEVAQSGNYELAGILHHNSGKTQSLAVQLVATLMQSPYPDWFLDEWGTGGENAPRGNLNGWLVVQSLPKNVKMQAWFQKLIYGERGTDEYGNPVTRPPLLPARVQVHVRQNPTVIEIRDGRRTHTITVLSSEMASVEFGSVNPDFIFIDEPTRDNIFTECRMRLAANPLCRIWYGLTEATGGLGHMADLQENKGGDVTWVTLDTRDNKFVHKGRLESVMASLDRDQFEARIQGRSASLTGLVYPHVFKWPSFFPDHESGRRSNFVHASELPTEFDQWTAYVVHDPGVSNPEATLWFRRAPDGDLWLYRCHYDDRPGANIRVKVQNIRRANRDDVIARSWIDPKGGAMHPPTASNPLKCPTVRDLYAECGWFFHYGPDSQDSIGRRERAMVATGWLEPGTQYPMLWIVDGPTMEPVKRELRRYKKAIVQGKRNGSWNNKETTARHNDHAMYCLETMCVLAAKGEAPYVPPLEVRVRDERYNLKREMSLDLQKQVRDQMGERLHGRNWCK